MNTHKAEQIKLLNQAATAIAAAKQLIQTAIGGTDAGESMIADIDDVMGDLSLDIADLSV